MSTNYSARSFIAATIALLVIFGASATPIPLYEVYHQTKGVSYESLSITAVVYFIGAVTALLFFGRISNHLGRKITTLLAFGLAAAAMLLFLTVESAFPLILGRFLLGLACGLASSSITAYVVDTAHPDKQWLASAIVSNSPLVGLTIGALASGLFVEYGPYQLMLCYLVMLGVIAVSAALILSGHETVDRQKGLIKSLKPRFTLSNPSAYPVAAITFVATWALGGFFQAYGPSIAAEQLHEKSTFIGSIVFASYLFPGAIGGLLSGKLTPHQSQKIGMIIFTLSLAGLVFSLQQKNLIEFLIASALAGTAQGAVLTGSIRSMLHNAQIKERAGVLSIVYATSYTGAAIPSYIAGQLSNSLSLLQLLYCYLGLAIFACAFTLFYPSRERTVASAHMTKSLYNE
ncbi:MAG: MFS transporter [Pseudomonadota bacterium]|nr:MFS transporter [Pseudomonadota bacterium]